MQKNLDEKARVLPSICIFENTFFFISYVATVFMLLLNTGKKICMKGKLMEGHFEEQV